MTSDRQSLFLLILILAMVAFHIATLVRFPPVFIDEAWLVSRAWAWSRTGINFGPLDAGVFDKHLEGYGTFYPIIPTLLLSPFIAWFGLAISWLRLLPLLFGFGLLAATFSLARQLSSSKRCGLIAALLVTTSHSFWISAHLIRFDIFVAALAYGSLAMVIAGCRQPNSILLFVAGLMISFAFEVHMNAAVFGPIIIAFLVAQRGWRFFGTWQFAAFTFGLLIGFATYFWLHIAQHPTAFFTMGQAMARSHLPPVLSNSAMQAWGSLSETAGYWIYFTYARILIVVLAAATLYRSGCEKSKILFSMLVFGLISFSLLIANKVYYYAILIGPLSDIFLAVWIHEIGLKKGELGFWLKRAKVLGIAVLIVTLGIPVFQVISTPRPGDLEVIGSRIKRSLPSSASLMGSPTYWFELYRHPYVSWMQIISHGLMESNSSVATAFGDLRPDFLIIDDDMRQYILPDRPNAPQSGFERYAWQRRISKEELDSFLQDRGALIDTFVTPTYGTIELYSIRWDTKK